MSWGNVGGDDPPTKLGSIICNVSTTAGLEFSELFRLDSDDLPWTGLDEDGEPFWFSDDEIATFDHARIVPNGVGVLDEDDKSPVVDPIHNFETN